MPGSARLQCRNGTMVLTRNDIAAVTCSYVASLSATALRFTAGASNSLVAHPLLLNLSGCSGISGTSSLSSISRHLQDWPISCVGCLSGHWEDLDFRSRTPAIFPQSFDHVLIHSVRVLKDVASPMARRWQSRSAADAWDAEWPPS